MKEIHNEIKALLEAFGYKPKVREYKTVLGLSKIDLYFHVNNGFDTMPIRYKDAISMLAKGFLCEFYYEYDTQHIYLYDDNKGLDPDDNRYGCLLRKIRTINEDSIPQCGSEVFINMGDHFQRLIFAGYPFKE